MGFRSRYSCIAIGVSSGGMNALSTIIPIFPRSFPVPVIIVQHISPQSDNYMTRYLDNLSELKVKEVDEKEKIIPGFVYTAPPNYHVLVEEDGTFSLSVEDRINFARPSVDVLFESAADIYGSRLVGVVLTGANNDGSKGLKKIKEQGGLTIVEDPATAEVDGMPAAAAAAVKVDYILPLEEIGPFLVSLVEPRNSSTMENQRRGTEHL
ncbi:MAG: chemotaxis protein CheB [bacterium]|nr:chemotaxis protein CheB [bacterium]